MRKAFTGIFTVLATIMLVASGGVANAAEYAGVVTGAGVPIPGATITASRADKQIVTPVHWPPRTFHAHFTKASQVVIGQVLLKDKHATVSPHVTIDGFGGGGASLRFTTRAGVSTSRSGSRVTITGSLARYAWGRGYVHYANKILAFQERKAGRSGWATIGFARTNSSGRAALGHTEPHGAFYKVRFSDADSESYWGATSTQSFI